MRNTGFPLALIAAGLIWIAREAGYFPNWPIVLASALIIVGVGVLITEGVNRSSVVSGPLWIYAGAAWIACLEHWLNWRFVVPIGVVVLGLLLLASRMIQLRNRPNDKIGPTAR